MSFLVCLVVSLYLLLCASDCVFFAIYDIAHRFTDTDFMYAVLFYFVKFFCVCLKPFCCSFVQQLDCHTVCNRMNLSLGWSVVKDAV